MLDMLALVAVLSSPIWILMLMNANQGRTRVQAIAGIVADLSKHYSMEAKKEGGDVHFSGTVEEMPVEFVASGLETSPRLKIRVTLPTSLKVISFRARDGGRPGKFESGDANFDAVVSTDGDTTWLGAILDAPTRQAIASLVLSLSGRIDNGVISAEIPIMLEEEGAPQSTPAPAPQTPPPPADGVEVKLGTAKGPTPPGTLGYLVSCNDKVLAVAKVLTSHGTVKVDRLAQQAREETVTGVRIAALKGLLMLQRPERVAGFVNDTDPVVRFFACSQVGDVGLAPLEVMLAEIPGPGLPSDSRLPPERTAEAIKAFRACKDGGRLREILARLCRSVDVPIRHAAIAAVARLAVPNAVGLYQSLPDLIEDRVPLIAALMALSDPAGETLLWKILATGDENSRTKVLEALTQLGTARSVEVLNQVALGKLPEPPKADGIVVYSEPRAGDKNETRTMVSAIVMRAAREIAAAIQRRLEGSSDVEASRAEEPEAEAEAKPPPKTEAPKSEEAKPIRAGEPGTRPSIKPLEAMEAEAAQAAENKGQVDIAARIAEAQARAMAMRNKSS